MMAEVPLNYDCVDSEICVSCSQHPLLSRSKHFVRLLFTENEFNCFYQSFQPHKIMHI